MLPSWSFLIVALVAGAAARMPGPAPQARAIDSARVNAACEACHTDVAREWRASMHAEADVDPVYQRALAREPMPFCRKCHAPEADPNAAAPAKLSAIGVGCVTCHQTGGSDAVLAGPGGPASKGNAPHAVVRDARFATPAACAGCHEFDFPDGASRARPERMQATVSEHAASPSAAASCASCHMPRREGRASHAFAASRDPAMLRSAVDARAERDATTLRLRLSPRHAGHAFPTGDLFRRLVVSAEAVGDDWSVTSEASRALHRRFAMRAIAHGHVGRVLVGDDRVGPSRSQDVELDLGAAARGRSIAWRVEYQRVEHPLGADESGAVVAESIVVAEGVLPAQQGAP
jgi:Cytochrome c554 and c-prime